MFPTARPSPRSPSTRVGSVTTVRWARPGSDGCPGAGVGVAGAAGAGAVGATGGALAGSPWAVLTSPLTGSTALATYCLALRAATLEYLNSISLLTPRQYSSRPSDFAASRLRFETK